MRSEEQQHSTPSRTFVDRFDEPEEKLPALAAEKIRRLEAELMGAQKLAALGAMAGGIAHEIRNPLAITSSAAQFLMEDDLSPEFLKECAKRIHEGIERVSTIIENQLQFVRPSLSGKGMEQVDLGSLVRDTLTLISNQGRLQGIELEVETPGTLVVVDGIPSMLEQLVLNLALNAFNSMPKGGGLCIRVEPHQEYVLVRVIDSGCGIPADMLDKVFTPSFTTASTGTGLGLSICDSIVRRHSGAITVCSVEGKGSTFTVKLPRPYVQTHEQQRRADNKLAGGNGNEQTTG